MKKSIIYFVQFLLFVPFTMPGQIGGLLNKAKDKAETKVEQKAEKKVEQKVDQSTTGSGSKSSSTTTSSGSTTTSGSKSESGTSSSSTASTPANTSPGEKLPYGEYHSNKSDFEITHTGQIVFTTNNFREGEPADLTSFVKTDFKATEPISAVFYPEHFIGNYPLYKDGNPSSEKKVNSQFKYEIKVFCDGKQIPSISGHYNGTYVNFPTHFYQTLADASSDGMLDAQEEWIMVVNSMSNGVHKLKFELWGALEGGFSTEKALCTGEMNLTKVEDIGNWQFESDRQKFHKTIDEFNAGKVKDNGITGETHKNNVGKIVFSKAHLGADGAENTSLIQSNFSGADQIYAKCFMKESLWNVPLYSKPTEYIRDTNFYSRTPIRNTNSKFTVVYLIDGKELKDIPEITNSPFDKYNEPEDVISNNNNEAPNDEESMKKKTNIELYIKTSKAELNKGIGSNDWALIANALAPGEHTVQITVWAGTKALGLSNEPICIGEFKYTKVAGLSIGVGKDWNVQAEKAGMSNPTLEAQMKSLLLKNDDVKGVYHLVITSSQWSVDRNELTGIILSRSISAWCVVKNTEGYYQVAWCTFSEDYNGSGYQGLYGGVDSSGVRYYVDGNTL